MKNIIVTILLGVFIISSCEKESDLNIPVENPFITANSFFTPDSLWTVQLAYSQNIKDVSETTFVNDAQVQILNSENILVETLDYTNSGRYISENTKPEDGVKYSLKITHNAETIIAQSNVPEALAINNIKLSKGRSIDIRYNKEEDFLFIDFDIIDDPNVENFYIAMLSTVIVYTWNNEEQMQVQKQLIEANDNIFEEFQSRDDFNDRVLFTDQTFNGKTKTIKLKRMANGLNETDGVNYFYQLTLVNCSREMYEYLLSLYYQKSSIGFESNNKPIKVVSNIKNGAGIFAGYTISNARLDADFINSVLEN